MYYVYVLQNSKGLLYKGHTNDLEKRVAQHNAEDEFPSFTKHRGPWVLVYSQEFQTRSAAKERETFLKTGKGRDFLKEYLRARPTDL